MQLGSLHGVSRHGRRTGLIVLAVVLGVATGCGARSSSMHSERVILVRRHASPADTVWRRFNARAADLGLTLSELHPREGILQFDWITAPGDARLYLRCPNVGAPGSASLRMRIRIVPDKDGSRVILSSLVRATTSNACESTGRFERWLLGRLDVGPPQSADDEALNPFGCGSDDPSSCGHSPRDP